MICSKFDARHLDNRFLAAAIRLAVIHEGRTGTNPSVACILVNDLGNGPVVVGSGVTAIGGRPHAEPIALEEAGDLAKGATAYVTLEPCAHHGRTPPCAEALITAGVSRVITAAIDPDDRVSGKGHDMLRDAGIEVSEQHEPEAVFGLAGYLKKKHAGKPFVTLKLAVSADGFLGLEGEGQFAITGPASRRQVHLMRAINDAILVGSGTANADNPDLTCRLPGMETRSPVRVVLAGKSLLQNACKLVDAARDVPTLLVSTLDPGSRDYQQLVRQGVEIIPPDLQADRVALPELLDDLGARGIATLMVEGGARVADSFMSENLVDRLVLFISPIEIGSRGTAIASPLTLDTLPPGYHLIEEMILPHGDDNDRMLTFEKKA